jgi:hypothetical protein
MFLHKELIIIDYKVLSYDINVFAARYHAYDESQIVHLSMCAKLSLLVKI